MHRKQEPHNRQIHQTVMLAIMAFLFGSSFIQVVDYDGSAYAGKMIIFVIYGIGVALFLFQIVRDIQRRNL